MLIINVLSKLKGGINVVVYVNVYVIVCFFLIVIMIY